MPNYVQRRGGYWVVVERGSNRVVARHRSRKDAVANWQTLEAGRRQAAKPRKQRGSIASLFFRGTRK
jgi:hypothetical protein